MKTKPKRNKKYNPKQIIKLKEHRFQMFWEVNEATNLIEMHHLLGGKTLQDEGSTPTKIWMNAHKGDLALALKMASIDSKQLFHCKSVVHARSETTGHEITCEFERTAPQKMTFREFLDDLGKDAPPEKKIYFIEDGFKKLWRGYDYYLEKYLESVGDDEYKVVTNHCVATCHSPFISFEAERDFKARKIVYRCGLGKDQ